MVLKCFCKKGLSSHESCHVVKNWCKNVTPDGTEHGGCVSSAPGFNSGGPGFKSLARL
jgi:hypothetical protein